MKPHEAIPLENVESARGRIGDIVMRTPLVRLNTDLSQAEIFLKLENLQPTGAFKLRGACNAMAIATQEQLANGVFTSSSGNMAQAVSWNALRLGIQCSVVVPNNAPATKLASVRRLGAQIDVIPYGQWWELMMTHHYPKYKNKLFLHPSSNPDVMAGYATIALELLEDLPDLEAVLIPWGSGGLICGIGSVFKKIRPEVKIYACEVETGAPLAASLLAGKPIKVEHTPSFVDGISAHSLPSEMWPLAQQVVEASIVVTLEDIIQSICTLVERHNVVAEGAGAASVAVALRGTIPESKIACIVTGGNIDKDVLATILKGNVPQIN